MSTIDPADISLPIDAADWSDDWSADDVAIPPAGRVNRTPAGAPTVAASGGLDMLINLARGRLTLLVEDARDSLVGQVRGLKSLADLLADNIGDSLGSNTAPVKRFIGNATATIDTIADTLAEKSVEELVDNGRELVRAQPVMAVSLAIAVGFLIGRIAKASQD